MILIEVHESFFRKADDIRKILKAKTGWGFEGHDSAELLSVMMDHFIIDNEKLLHKKGESV